MRSSAAIPGAPTQDPVENLPDRHQRMTRWHAVRCLPGHKQAFLCHIHSAHHRRPEVANVTATLAACDSKSALEFMRISTNCYCPVGNSSEIALSASPLIEAQMVGRIRRQSCGVSASGTRSRYVDVYYGNDKARASAKNNNLVRQENGFIDAVRNEGDRLALDSGLVVTPTLSVNLPAGWRVQVDRGKRLVH